MSLSRDEFHDKLIPVGYEVEETDKPLETSLEPPRFLTKKGAKAHAQRFPSSSPLWRYEVERKGLFHWEAIPYQNRLVKSS